jgi:hypothetical protein
MITTQFPDRLGNGGAGLSPHTQPASPTSVEKKGFKMYTNQKTFIDCTKDDIEWRCEIEAEIERLSEMLTSMVYASKARPS